MSKPTNPIDQFIKALGGPTKAAAAIGVDGANVVLNWRKRKQVPADKVLAIEAASGVSRHELRPDVFGDAA